MVPKRWSTVSAKYSPGHVGHFPRVDLVHLLEALAAQFVHAHSFVVDAVCGTPRPSASLSRATVANGRSTETASPRASARLEILLAQSAGVEEGLVQEVVRLQRRHVVAEHDRARAAGDRVGVPHHLAEFLEVQPAGLGELRRLAGSGERDEVKHVAGQLHSRAGAGFAGMDHQRRPPRERLLDQLERLVVGADHDRHLTLLGGPRPAADRRVDDVDALRFELAGQVDGGGVADRGVDRDHGAGLGISRQFADDLAHLVVVEDRDADDVGGGHVGHAVGQRGAGLGEWRHRVDAHVEHREPAGPVDQPLGDRRAHIAQADDSRA